VSLTDIMKQPARLSGADESSSDLSFEARAAIRAWLLKVFREIQRVRQILDVGVLTESQEH
jgi:hypothetical protein